MNKVHDYVSQQCEWYNSWHKHPKHQVVHWLAFVAVAVLVSASMITGINNTALGANANASANGASHSNSGNSNSNSGNSNGNSNNSSGSNFDNGPSGSKFNNARPNIQDRLGKNKQKDATQNLQDNNQSVGVAQDHILVKFKNNVGQAKKAAVLAKHGLSEKSEIKQIGVKLVNIPDSETPDEAIDSLKAQDGDSIAFAEIDGGYSYKAIPNDPSYSNQWYLSKISAPQAWDISTGSPAIIIAVIDTKVDTTHPDLANKFVSGADLVTPCAYDHGTEVSGTAAASTDNGVGIAGVAWNVKIMPLSVFKDIGSGCFAYWSDVANAISYAASHGAKVINLSLGGSSDSSTMQDAINNAWAQGLVIVAAEGNEGNNVIQYPAGDQNVVAVSATDDSADTFATWSSFGSNVDLSAPGDYIYTTDPGGTYQWWAGTSFSAPIVSAEAALLFSVNPTLTNAQVVNLMEQNADDLGTSGWDQYYGYGRVNVYKAVLAASQIQRDATAPSTPTNLTASAVSSSQVNLSWSASTDNVGVAGYNIYRNGGLIATVPTLAYQDKGLTGNTSYSYSVSAFDAVGNSSVASNTVNITTPAAVTLVSITSFQVTNKTTISATVVWTTNIPSTGTLSYGTTKNSLSSTVTDGVAATSHSIKLTNLSSFTTYYYKIAAVSQDSASSAATGVSSFKTVRK